MASATPFAPRQGQDETFQLTAFPADEGDCLLLSYGAAGRRQHILVDCGTARTYGRIRPYLQALADAGGVLEALVVTHIDSDHIGGAVEFLKDGTAPLVPKDIWFNGLAQLSPVRKMGFAQAEELSKLISSRQLPHNMAFGGRAILTGRAGAPFGFAGLDISLLSPDASKTTRLEERWRKWLAEHPQGHPAPDKAGPRVHRLGRRKEMPGLDDLMALAAPTDMDTEPPNGSSIALMVQRDGKTVLLAADAHPDMICNSIDRIWGQGRRVHVDLFKLSHHGSHGNTTKELCERIECSRFLLSTSGARHCHPDAQAIARLLLYSGNEKKTLYFNYESDWTRPWLSRDLANRHNYDFVRPGVKDLPLVVTI